MPYKDPEAKRNNARERSRRYRESHRELVRQRNAARYAADPEAAKQAHRTWFENNRERAYSYALSNYYATRDRLFDTLGRVCVGCGHADQRVLEFDHINDDGGAERRRFKGSRSLVEYYAKHPEEARLRLQALCRNCNWLKRKGHPLPNAAQTRPDLNTIIARAEEALQREFADLARREREFVPMPHELGVTI